MRWVRAIAGASLPRAVSILGVQFRRVDQGQVVVDLPRGAEQPATQEEWDSYRADSALAINDESVQAFMLLLLHFDEEEHEGTHIEFRAQTDRGWIPAFKAAMEQVIVGA